MLKVTKRLIDAAKATSKDMFLWDDELAGYGLKVMPSGRKVFVLQYRIGGWSRRMTLGTFCALTADQARSMHRPRCGKLRAGMIRWSNET